MGRMGNPSRVVVHPSPFLLDSARLVVPHEANAWNRTRFRHVSDNDPSGPGVPDQANCWGMMAR